MRLHCTIKKQYLDMIMRGSKTTEYREMSEYWCRKILDMEHYQASDIVEVIGEIVDGKHKLYTKPYSEIQFYCGMQRPVFQVKAIRVYRGHPIFAIKLGKKLKDQ